MTIGLIQNQSRSPKRIVFRLSTVANLFLVCGFALFVCLSTTGNVASADEQLTAGSSSKQLRNQTAKSIPYQQLTPQTRDKISAVVEKPSIYRRLPVTAINVDPDHFRFLVRYPEVIVNIWQLMGVTKMKTERTGPYTVKTNDGAGTISSLDLVYGTDQMHIFYGTGTYEGPVLRRKLSGECVIVLRSDSRVGQDGKPVQTSQLDVFLKVNNATAGLIAKTIQPLVGTTADHNFVESLKFVQRLNETTSKNGPGVAQMSEKLDIDADVRQKYKKIVDLVFQRAIKSAAPAGPAMARPSQLSSPTSARATSATTRNPRGTFDTLGDSQQPSGFPKTSQSQQPTMRSALPARGSLAPDYDHPRTGRTSGQNFQPAAPSYGYGYNKVPGTNSQQVRSQSGYPVLQIPPYDPSLSRDPRYRTHSQVSGTLPNYQTVPMARPIQTQPMPQSTQGWHGR